MREISISTDVFSLIWASRLPGEESENDILLRLLSKDTPKKLRPEAPQRSVKSTMVSLRRTFVMPIGKYFHFVRKMAP